MKQYIATRLTQKSTWIGIAAIFTSLVTSWGTISPDLVITVMTALGLVDINA